MTIPHSTRALKKLLNVRRQLITVAKMMDTKDDHTTRQCVFDAGLKTSEAIRRLVGRVPNAELTILTASERSKIMGYDNLRDFLYKGPVTQKGTAELHEG